MMRDETELHAVIEVVRRHAVPLDLETAAERLLDAIDPNASLVLIGEATHGSHEFYRIRADLTRALIQCRGFVVVAVEADWPDAYRANRWVRLLGDDDTAEAALADFTRFPGWMWRNRDVVRFLRWLRVENAERPADARVGFYGLDLYSLHRSIARVIEYLDKVDPGAAQRARRGYACFDVFGEDVQLYGYAASLNLERSCEDEVIQQLVELRRRAAEYATRDGRIAADEYFAAEQNARVVRNAETYYRAMCQGNAESWNVRDRHMMTTLEALLAHAGSSSQPARAVVWAHNSHLGDARATSMADIGELNLGELARRRFGTSCVAIGMTTHDGDVTAAHEWDEPAALRSVRPSLAGSYERLFHETGLPSFLLRLSTPELASVLAGPRPERAIGVIYRPETERASHYLSARLPKQFDLVVHVDRTRALEPLEKWSRHEIDLPETYPTGV
jgi:erythromycin esterase-like protein